MPIDEQLSLFGTLKEALSPGALQLLSPDDLFKHASEELLAALHEDSRIERKPAGIQLRELGDYFSMWANTSPDGGLIIVGQEDGGSFSGCVKANRTNDLMKCASIYAPLARHEVRKVRVRGAGGGDDFVLVFRVYFSANRVVLNSKGEAFIRSADEKKKLTPDEIRQIESDRGQVQYELEQAPYRFPEDFDQDLIRQFSEAWLVERGLTPGSRTPEEVLEMAHLGLPSSNQSLRPNVACSILFAKSPALHFPGSHIRFQRFMGESEGTGSRYNIVKDQFIHGPLPKMITQAEAVLRANLREFARLGPDKKFTVQPEYPEEAWYETIVNACVHRSYLLKNMPIFVRMFDDRIVIESPGGFPPLVTPENIYEVHHPRNPHLMRAMYSLRFVRMAREGTRRIRASMEILSLPAPEFKQSTLEVAPVVRVTLTNEIKQRSVWIDSEAASTVIGETVFSALTTDERRALNYVVENGVVTVSDLARITSRAWTTAKKVLERLERRGLLQHVKKKSIERDPHAHYILRTRR